MKSEPVVTFVIRGALRMLSIIHRSKLLRLFLPLTPNQQGSPCCLILALLIQTYGSKLTHIGFVYADDIAQSVFIYVLWIAFPMSPFSIWGDGIAMCDVGLLPGGRCLIGPRDIKYKTRLTIIWENHFFEGLNFKHINIYVFIFVGIGVVIHTLRRSSPKCWKVFICLYKASLHYKISWMKLAESITYVWQKHFSMQ